MEAGEDKEKKKQTNAITFEFHDAWNGNGDENRTRNFMPLFAIRKTLENWKNNAMFGKILTKNEVNTIFSPWKKQTKNWLCKYYLQIFTNITF